MSNVRVCVAMSHTMSNFVNANEIFVDWDGDGGGRKIKL